MSDKLTLVDKTIGFFSPKYAYQAEKFRMAASIFGGGLYNGATRTPHYNPDFLGSTEDQDIQDLPTLRNTSRDKYKNNGFYKGVIQCTTDHVVGSGLKAKSTIRRNMVPGLTEEQAKFYEKMMDNYFNAWAESTICDATGKDNFYEIQALVYKVYKKDGDSFSTLPMAKIGGNRKVIQIDLIGAENIESNNIDYIEGIKFSDKKFPLKYSILQSDGTHKEITAFKGGKRNVMHIFKREREKMARGIPFLTPVMRPLDAIDQLMDYELSASKLSAIFFGSLTTKTKENVFGGGEEVDLLSGSQTQTVKSTVKENSITQLQPDEELNIHESGRDNPNFNNFIKTQLQKVSTQTRIPLEIILAQFISSYTASRAAMLLMEKFVKPERDNIMIPGFCKPTRDQVITWGVLQGDLVIPNFFEHRGAYLHAMWLGDPMGSVDPMKDVNSKIKALEHFLTTGEKATIDLGGGDYQTNIQVRNDELDLEAPLREKQREALGETNDNN